MPADHHRRGVLLFEAHRHALAAEAFRAELEQDPSSAGALEMLARCYLHLDRVGEALDCARQAVALAPDRCRGHEALAWVELRRGRRRAALAASKEALRLHPEGTGHHEQHAHFLGLAGKWKASLAAAERGLALDAEDVGCLNRRALALDALGRTDEQLQTARTALAIAPEDPTAHALCGWSLLRGRELARARGHLEEALRQEPDYDWAELGLGRLRTLERPVIERLRSGPVSPLSVLCVLGLVVLACSLPDPWASRCLGILMITAVLVLPVMIALEVRDRLRGGTRRRGG